MKVQSETASLDRRVGSRRISRRACLPLITCALLSPPALTQAQAEGERWPLFRRDDAGFEIEVPVKLELWLDESLETKLSDPNAIEPLGVFEGSVRYNDLVFGIKFQEFRRPPPMDFYLRYVREHPMRSRNRYTRETPLTTYGVPAVELAFEYDLLSGSGIGTQRVIMPSNGVIDIQVTGKGADNTNPLVRRFFESLNLFSPTATRRR